MHFSLKKANDAVDNVQDYSKSAEFYLFFTKSCDYVQGFLSSF